MKPSDKSNRGIFYPSTNVASLIHSFVGGFKKLMLDNFVTFEGSPNGSRGRTIRVTLGPNRSFLLSRSAWEGMGEPRAVELAFDDVDRKIAMRPCPPDKKNAFRVSPRSSGSHRMICAGAFITHFNIHTAHTVLFDEVQFTPDNTMILNLADVTRVGRGSR